MSEAPALPQSFEDLRRRILERHARLPRRLAQAARYAVEHPEEIAFGTAASVASAAAVQPSTLVRLAQSLGFGGFSELQALFRAPLRERTTSYDERLVAGPLGRRGEGSQAMLIASGVFAAAQRSVESVGRGLDGATLDAACRLLAGAGTIYVLAQRRSYPAAVYLGYVLGKLRMRNVVAGSPSGTDEDLLALASREDAAVSISFTPYAAATLEWTRGLADRGVPVVGITDSAFSPIATLSAAWIEVAEPDFEGFRSLSATMALSVSLAVAAAKLRR